MTKDIAIIIPCYNHANVLRRTLQGIQNQTLKPREVVVVDDGSVDDPLVIVDEFRDILPITFVRFETNRGAPAARNEGARRTSSPLVLFLDADAELAQNALETFADTLELHPSVSFAYANFFWGHHPFKGCAWDPVALRANNYIHTSSLIRRDAFPGFDEALKKFQDWDVWLTMSEQGKSGVWIDQFLYRIEPRREGYSRWLPKIAYQFPWKIIGWTPQCLRRYFDAKRVIIEKHHL